MTREGWGPESLTRLGAAPARNPGLKGTSFESHCPIHPPRINTQNQLSKAKPTGWRLPRTMKLDILKSHDQPSSAHTSWGTTAGSGGGESPRWKFWAGPRGCPL